MKTILLAIIAFFLLTSTLFAQPGKYEKGKIITKNNDTLNVLVELAFTYIDKVTYKTSPNSDIKTIRISEIKQVFTPYNEYKNIALKKTEKLFRMVINDTVSLLQYFERNPGQVIYKDGGSFSKDNPPTIIYAIKTNTDVIIIKNKKDKDLLLPLCDNCPEVKALIQSTSFELEKLDDTVKRINSCIKK